jgi:hypothetical protein
VETHKVAESKGQVPAKAARRAAHNAGAWLFASTEIFYDGLFLRERGRAMNDFQSPLNYWASNYRISEIIQKFRGGQFDVVRSDRTRPTTAHFCESSHKIWSAQNSKRLSGEER